MALKLPESPQNQIPREILTAVDSMTPAELRTLEQAIANRRADLTNEANVVQQSEILALIHSTFPSFETRVHSADPTHGNLLDASGAKVASVVASYLPGKRALGDSSWYQVRVGASDEAGESRLPGSPTSEAQLQFNLMVPLTLHSDSQSSIPLDTLVQTFDGSFKFCNLPPTLQEAIFQAIRRSMDNARTIPDKKADGIKGGLLAKFTQLLARSRRQGN